MRQDSIEQIVRYIGIDFGTSTSAVFFKDYYEDGRPLDPGDAKPLMFGRSPTIPTVILTDSAGYTHFGVEAQVRAQDNPELLRSEFKMDLLKVEDRGLQTQAEDMTRAFLKHLHKMYKQQATITEGAEVKEERPFVSYPSKWPAPVREVMIEASRQAGFEGADGMIEPEAAMRYFLAIRTQEYKRLQEHGVIVEGRPLNVLLVDMGAGTTDLVLYRFVPGGSSEVLGTWPPIDRAERGAHLGGREVDELLFSRVIEPALPEGFLDELGELKEQWIARVKQDTTQWKENTLSPVLRDGGSIDNLPSIIRLTLKGQLASKVAVGRQHFETVFEEYFESFSSLVDGLIEHAKEREHIRGGEDVDLTILTGGHSQWYFVEEILTGRLPQHREPVLRKIREEPIRLLKGPHPQETVARGMALSGMPIRISKTASNNAWLKIKLGDTDVEAISIQQSGDLLPFDRKVFTAVSYRFPSLDEYMPGQCALVVGESLADGKEFKPEMFPVPYKGFFNRLLQRVSPSDQAGICLDIHVDENEHYTIVGLIQSKRGKGYGFFAVNRKFPNDFERAKLVQVLRQWMNEGG